MKFLNILLAFILTAGTLGAQVNTCDIVDLQVQTGDCTSDSTFKLLIDFQVVNPTNDSFEVWTGNNQSLGVFALSDLPLSLTQFPTGNSSTGFVQVCINGNPNCCAIQQFMVPDCSNALQCVIQNLGVQIGDCNDDGSYQLWLNFSVNAPTDSTFSVWAGGGQFLGSFPLSGLPLLIPGFTGTGGPVDELKVCIDNNPDCCAAVEWLSPICPPNNDSCRVRNLVVQTGNCTSDSTYTLWMDFQTQGTMADSFQVFDAGGNLLGTWPLTQVPLIILDFPWNGQSTDAFTVCVGNGNDACCRTREFNVPECLGVHCGIEDIKVEIGNCSSDSTYSLTLSFSVPNWPTVTDSFELYSGTGVFLGNFSLSQLPLTLDNFPWSGDDFDYLKICVSDSTSSCCRIVEFSPPDCNPDPCGIYSLRVLVGDCNDSGGFALTLNFESLMNIPVDSFGVWAGNGQFLGFFTMNQLPLTIEFPWSGGYYEEVKICVYAGGDICCRTKRFRAPECTGVPCGLSALHIETGPCNDDGTYQLWLNFNFLGSVLNAEFEVWSGTGQSLGIYHVSDLPILIDSFPWSGGAMDVIKVCLTGTTIICCQVAEFDAPDCLFTGPCEIYDVSVVTGDCNNNGTYNLTLDFEVQHPTNMLFEVWAGNGQYLGIFPLNQLPVQIPNFPGSGNDHDVIKICLNDNPDCCTVFEFLAPNCPPGGCEIYDLHVDTGDCTGDSTYTVTINFQVQNGGGATHFGVWANGVFLDTFPLSALPLTIQDFPWNGGQHDVIKVCLLGPNNDPYCCRTQEFLVPSCLNPGGPCEIYNLQVDTGDCTGDSTYTVTINFQIQNGGGATHFGVWANGVFLDSFPLSSLPLTIQDFPWNGGQQDVIKVCLLGPNNDPYCCRTEDFQVPGCLNPGGPCEIYNLQVDTGDCTGDSTYTVTINFQIQNGGGATHFGVWANGAFLDTFPLSALPLTIQDFPWNGGQQDVIKVCLLGPNNDPYCCRTEDFLVPGCLNPGGPCEIYNLQVVTGDCTGDSTYIVTINFQVQNGGGATHFGVWANNVFLDSFPLSSLPLTIQDFPWNGGQQDVIKVCLLGPNNDPYCCRTREFLVPDCLNPGGPCEIYNLHVETGECTSDSTYEVWVNFQVQNGGGATHFGVWANNVFLGFFPLANLPLYIQDFPWNGGFNDVVKVCLVNPNQQPYCCRSVEFPVPGCLSPVDPCEIYDLHVDTGACTSDSTYTVTVNFQVQNGGNATEFGVWANGAFLGNFPLSSLPLTIQNFPWNGGQNDVIKVCLIGSAGDPYCCRTLEFAVPDCLDPGGPCEIYNLNVDTGDCTSDSTYNLWINFQVQNPGNATMFGVWGNGQFLGLFPLNQLPLQIQNFPWNGGAFDEIRVCLVAGPNQPPYCCREKVFEVPDCLGGSNCNIWDLHVIRTECLCGQFFAVLTFNHSGGGNGGFDIVGNGNNYGNFPYNTLQPIILGPFVGDGTTMYEFAVIDHNNPDCFDDFNLGKVDCDMVSVHDPAAGGSLVLSPNPASHWLQVTAQIAGQSALGEGDVDIIQPDGRLVRTQHVGNAGSFNLDVSDLPSGLFRVTVKTAAGRLEGSFVKQ